MALSQRCAHPAEAVVVKDDHANKVESFEEDQGVAIASVAPEVNEMLVHPPPGGIGKVTHLDSAAVCVCEVPALLHSTPCHLTTGDGECDVLSQLCQGVAVRAVTPEGRQELEASSAVCAQGGNQRAEVPRASSLYRRLGCLHGRDRTRRLGQPRKRI